MGPRRGERGQMTRGKSSVRVNAPQQRVPQAAEVRVLGVVDLGDTPRVDPGTDGLPVDLNLLLGADDGERHHRL